MGWKYWRQPSLQEEVKPHINADIPICYEDMYEVGNPDAHVNRRIYALKHGSTQEAQNETLRAAGSICELLQGIDEPFVLTWVPSSTAYDDPEGDERLKGIAMAVAERLPACRAVETILNTVSRDKLHETPGLRFPAKVAEHWKQANVDIRGVSRVYVLDDVVTSGASMAGAFRIMRWMVSPWTLVTGLALTVAVKSRNIEMLRHA